MSTDSIGTSDSSTSKTIQENAHPASTPPVTDPAPLPEQLASSTNELPIEIQSRLDAWHKLWNESAQLHYVFGALSVTASAAAAATGGISAQYLSAAAAVLTALIGFVQPERRYFKFANAWRVLDIAAFKYKKGRIDIDSLIDALEQGERIISEYESKDERTPAESQPAPAPARQPKVS